MVLTVLSVLLQLAAAAPQCAPMLAGFESIATAPHDGSTVELQGGHSWGGKGIPHWGLFKWGTHPQFVNPGWVSLDGTTFYVATDPCLYWRSYSGPTNGYVAPDGKTEHQRICARAGNTDKPFCQDVKK